MCKITLLHLSGKWSPGWNSAAVRSSMAPFPSDLWQDEEEVGSQMLRSRERFPGLVLSRGMGTDMSPVKTNQLPLFLGRRVVGHWAGSGWTLAHPTAHGWVWQQLCVALSWCCPEQLMWEAGMELMGVRGKKMSPLFALMGSKLLFELTGGCEWHPTETCECVYWCESGWCFVQEWSTALERDQK